MIMKTGFRASMILMLLISGLFATKTFAQCCVAPANLQVVSVGKTDADLQWDRVTQVGCTTPTKYKVRFRVVGTTTWTRLTVKTHKDDLTGDTTLLGLTSSTTYEWQVRGICTTSSKTGWVAGPNFTTLAAPRLSMETPPPATARNMEARIYPTVVQEAIAIVGQLRYGGTISVTVFNDAGQPSLTRSFSFEPGAFTTAID